MNEILKGFALVLLMAGALTLGLALGYFWPNRPQIITVHLDQPVAIKVAP